MQRGFIARMLVSLVERNHISTEPIQCHGVTTVT